MELEYKWRIPKESLSVLAAFLHSHPGRLSQDTLLIRQSIMIHRNSLRISGAVRFGCGGRMTAQSAA